MAFRKGTLLSLHGSFGSGLALLTVDEEVPHGATRLIAIPCDAGPTSSNPAGTATNNFPPFI